MGFRPKTVHALIQELVPELDLSAKQASNHWRYLLRKGVEQGQLKPKSLHVQSTTALRTMVNPGQQARWHVFIDCTQKKMYLLNAPAGEFKKWEHFAWWNYDEECIMASGHNIKIVASKLVNKHESISLGRVSIIALKTGCAAGVWSPIFS